MGRLNAQTWVTIPDANFATYLQGLIPAAMNGNQMDTTSVLVATTTRTISVVGKYIKDLTGITYFKSLKSLDCSYNNSLTTLPTLPNSITYINCQHDSLTSITNLPTSLYNLYCPENFLTTLPTLPNSLSIVNCQLNLLVNLPAFDTSLQSLECNSNHLTNLPPLPNSLTYLDCSQNQLTTLPSLPNSLTYLDCLMNSLTSLPALDTSLNTLTCSKNSLTNLPALPNSLIELDCDENLLSNLPLLPNSLHILNCGGNNISCFPAFPNSIYPANYVPQFSYWEYFINLDPNPYNCLPNYLPNSMTPTDLAKPLCGAGNSNGCAIAGINQLTDLNNQVNIYPNPTSGQFIIESNTAEKQIVQIIDVNGRIVLSETLTGITNIDATNFNEGVYTLVIKTANSIANKKLVVIH